MSKKTRKRKRQRRAERAARRITVGKIARLALKSVLFAVVASLAMVLLDALGVPGLDRIWVQGGAIVVLYLLAYPVLMSEFRKGAYLESEN